MGTPGNMTAEELPKPPPPLPELTGAAEAEQHAVLNDITRALDDVLHADPPCWFADSYHLEPTRAFGRHTVMQQCVDPKCDHDLIAKFFPTAAAFDQYNAMNDLPMMRPVMPMRHRTFTNELGLFRAPTSRFRFPPFLVAERGIPLALWASQERTPAQLFAVFVELVSHLVTLHDLNLVHRQLNGETIVFMPHVHKWRLLRVNESVPVGAPLSAAHPFPQPARVAAVKCTRVLACRHTRIGAGDSSQVRGS